jgi:hypothetical protein
MAVCAPDFADPRVGWRVWNVVEADGALRLTSLVYRTIWHPGREVTARCRRPLAALPWSRMPLHGPPNFDCCCGIYAVRTAEQAVPYLRVGVENELGSSMRVIGRVALWGRIVESDQGWRASFGYPEHLFVFADGSRSRRLRCLAHRGPSAANLSEALEEYGVPVDVAARLP